MKGRNQTSVKAGSSRKKVPSDVTPSTSLPPLVEGHLRCFLQVTVSRLLWTVPKPPPATFVRLRWWGESSNGTHFHPKDGSQLSQKIIKTTAQFPICCGSKQFTAYLADMETMVLEVLTKQDQLPCAEAQILGISSLSMTRSISGFYTLLSPTSKKLGELQVSLSLVPLSEAYDSRGSVHTRDMGVNGPPAIKITAPAEPRSSLASRHKQSARTNGRSTPRGKDHLYFRSSTGNGVLQENLKPSSTSTANDSLKKPEGQSTNDIISIVSEREDKLKNAILESGDTASGQTLKDVPLPLQRDNAQPLSTSSGTLLHNIMHSDSTLLPQHDTHTATDCVQDAPSDIDNKVVELLLGRLDTSHLPQLDCDEPYSASGSEHSSVCVDSELNDPQFDQSLLDNLFYKNLMFNSRADDEEADIQEAELLRDSPVEKPVSPSGRYNGDNHVSAAQSDNYGIPLSPEHQSQLCSIRSAKVSIISMTVTSSCTSTSPKIARYKGKLSPSVTGIKCTYFVEFVFPMAPSPRRRCKAPEQKVIRAVSSKITEGVVKFQQSSSFPVQFNHANAEEWWSSDLVFSIYSRRSHQKKAVLVGKAVHSLGCLLQNPQLSQTVTLPVLNVEGMTHEIGPLKVSLELVMDNLYSENIKRNNTPRKSRSKAQHLDLSREEEPSQIFDDSRLDSRSPEKYLKVSNFHSDYTTSPRETLQQVEEEPVVLLHTLLMVPDGKDFNCGSSNALNVYLNCKQFWSDEMARSVVSWGQANPCFNFVQVTPVALTSKLLERMKNNVMVIEVWRKMGSSGHDQLFGLVKLPLQQFYMSFRDPKITNLLLQAQYPVLGVDCYMPVIDVLSGIKGHLRVILAMGHSEQILALQRTRDEETVSSCPPVRPCHPPDHHPRAPTEVNVIEDSTVREHLFIIRVEGINGLTPLQSTVWGEADCFVQYSFPCQDGNSKTSDESDVTLKCFRTTSSLCVPDPVFSHTETHVLWAPEEVPVQQLLLRSLSGKGQSSRGGVQFEVWCRYYYPNVRDQLVAKGNLPLSKLCTTMAVQRPDEPKTFSLPLVPQTESPKGRDPQPSGVLDICVRYKHRPLRAAGMSFRGAASRLVTLVVEVHRACGLQAAARVVSESDGRFSYFAGVGVNTYVTVQLSFLPDNERRCTRVAARNFCPEFDHHTEVSCDLLHQRSTGETCSLAEQLEEASAIFTVWNRDNRKKGDTSRLQDVILGIVKIPLAHLLHKRTGISGWFGVSLPQETSSSQDQNMSVGALEISISFAHRSDRDRVIKAANGLGWEMSRLDPGCRGDDTFWEGKGLKTSFTFSMPRVWIPLHCLLLPGHSELQRSTYCYFRYKFYDKDAVCSQMKHPAVVELNHPTVSFEGSRTVELMRTQPLMWYLQEEKLEIQVWVAFKKDKAQRPSDTDRLVGSAFLDLSSLSKTSEQRLTLSGVYPLFRSSAPDLQGAALRVHITRTSCGYTTTVPDNRSDSEEEEEPTEDAEAANQVPSSSPPTQSYLFSRHQKTSPEGSHEVSLTQETKVDSEETFPVTITVDRAMHLNLKGCPLAERNEKTPCCCVSYLTADSSEPVSTAVVVNTDCPLWDHQHECRLSKQLLVDPQQSLVFKVWHKGDTERVIGFASVDLSPLLYGFQSVCGWYNITDFGGHCHGQLKVSVTPLKRVQDLRGERKTVEEGSNSDSSPPLQLFPVNYHTTATYSSFPSHISRYPEQMICSPEESFISEKSVGSNRHSEHMDNVRMYHQSLQEQTSAFSVCSSSAGDSNPSSSVLFSTLRKKLSELDNIQKYFSHKVATPYLFPPTTDQESHVTPSEECEQETNTSELLFKSQQLVGEVNKIVSGLRGQNLETIPSIPESHSPSSLGDDPLTIPEIITSPLRASVSSEECSSQHLSPPPKSSDCVSEVEEVEDEERYLQNQSADEREQQEDDDDDKSECSGEEEDDEDGDYEAVVVKPRHLNELTSLTDKTSPWTSVLSDPDLDTVECDEGSEHTEEEEQIPQTSQSNTEFSLDCGGKLDCTLRGENEDSESDDPEEATTCDDTQRAAAERRAEDSDTDSPLTSDRVAKSTQEASPSLKDEDTDPDLAVPNFFLPTHQLEASLRAVRLAPTFSLSSSDTERRSNTGRIPRQPPNMSPTSRKRELDRIAKIFKAHYDQNQS